MTAQYEVRGADRLARTLADAAGDLANLDAQPAGRMIAQAAARTAPRQTGHLAASHAATSDGVKVSARYAGYVHARKPWLAQTARRTDWTDAYADQLAHILDNVHGI